MHNRRSSIYSHEFSLKFWEHCLICLASEEGWSVKQPNSFEYNNHDEDNNSNKLVINKKKIEIENFLTFG